MRSFRVFGSNWGVADEDISEHRKLYNRIEKRKAGQLASEADVTLAYSRLAQAQSRRDQIAGELQVAKDDLRFLTQVDVYTGDPVSPELAELPGPETIQKEALEENADIRYKKKLITVAESNVSVEKTAAAPTLYAKAQWDFLDSATDNEPRFGVSFEGSLDGAGLDSFNRVKVGFSAG